MKVGSDIGRFADKGISLELLSFCRDSVFDSVPFEDAGYVSFFIAGGVDMEEESGGRIDLFGRTFDVEFIVGEVIGYFSSLFIEPVNHLHW